MPGSVSAAVAEAAEDRRSVLDAGQLLGKGIKMTTAADRTEATRRLQEKISEMRATRNLKPVCACLRCRRFLPSSCAVSLFYLLFAFFFLFFLLTPPLTLHLLCRWTARPRRRSETMATA